MACLITYRLHIGFQFIVYSIYSLFDQNDSIYSNYDKEIELIMDDNLHKLKIENNNIIVTIETVFIIYINELEY